jgi:hypothetical protein
VLVLKGMDMKRWSFPTGGKGASQVYFFRALAVSCAIENETLAVMA